VSADRKKIGEEFHRRTGLKPFSPEFVESMVAVMRDPRSCLSERVFAWSKWRAWFNSSEHAVSDWDPAIAKPLDQVDAALDLAWFQEGRPIEWVEGMPENYRTRAREPGTPERPPKVKDPARMSEAFTKNDGRGTVICQGRKVIPVISPRQAQPSKLRIPATFRTDKEFLTWDKLANSRKFEDWQLARKRIFEEDKLARIRYRMFKSRATSEAANLIDVMPLPNTGNEEHACMPPEPRLAALRDILKGHVIRDEVLEEQDRYFTSQLRERYHPDEWVAFVAARAAQGRLQTGVVFDHKLLPHDFIAKTKRDAARRRALQQTQDEQGEAARRRGVQLAQETIDDPTASEADKNFARAFLGVQGAGGGSQ